MSDSNVVRLADYTSPEHAAAQTELLGRPLRSKRTGPELLLKTPRFGESQLYPDPSEYLGRSDLAFLREQVEESIAFLIGTREQVDKRITFLIGALDAIDARHAELEPDVDGEPDPEDEASDDVGSLGSPEWRPLKTSRIRPTRRAAGQPRKSSASQDAATSPDEPSTAS